MTYNRHRYPPNPFKTLVFVLIGAALIILTDLFILDGKRHIWQTEKSGTEELVDVSSLREQHQRYITDGIIPYETTPHIGEVPDSNRAETVTAQNTPQQKPLTEGILTLAEVLEREKQRELAAVEPAVGVETPIEEQRKIPTAPYKDILIEESEADNSTNKTIDDITADLPSVTDESVSYIKPTGTGLVAIIIDDMGLGLRSRQVEVLPGPLTLAYLPYADNLPARTKRASNQGHELMVHIPMEAMNKSLDGGPKVLRTSQGSDEFMEILEWGLSRFDGYVGINNHMGSRLTSDKDAMRRVMRKIKDKGIYFIDSKTIGSSVAAQTAREEGIPYAERDIFLDHEITRDFVEDALKKLERRAKNNGYAIAIGHPHKETITALKKWLPTLEDKGLTLVPASKLVHQPENAISQR